MILRSRQVNPLAVAGVGGAIIAVLIGAALHPPAWGSGSPFASPEWVSVTDPVMVSCPDVARRLPARPAPAAVTPELATLERQIVDANLRLARYPEQAADQLTDIADKRLTVIDRIVTDITDAGGVSPADLTDLAACSLQRDPTGSLEASGSIGKTATAEAADVKPTTHPTKGAHAKGGSKARPSTGGSASSDDPAPKATKKPTGGGAQASSGADDPVETVQCPSVEDHLPTVPAAAAAEVDQNLAELEQQITDAEAGIAALVAHPVDDPNFIQNTILGPLRDRRIATIDRITIAISRVATAPTDLADLAPCTLTG